MCAYWLLKTKEMDSISFDLRVKAVLVYSYSWLSLN